MAVIGPSDASADEIAAAERVGSLLAAAGAVVVCGGLGGVMEAACRGAALHGGQSIGLLPGRERSAGNAYLTVTLPTGLGEMRNALVVGTSDAVIAVGGSWGTLSELALAVRTGKPSFTLGGWAIQGTDDPAAATATARGPVVVQGPDEAVAAALAAIAQ